LEAGQFEKSGPSGAEQAAEKWGRGDESFQELPSGPKGPIDFAAFAARLKSCPFKAESFSAACEALDHSLDFSGTSELVPFQNSDLK
jgi:hypothetical protein